jgi:hypothetical protein
MNRTLLIFVFTTILSIMSGCGIAVKTVVDTARGGTSDILIIRPVRNLQAYDSIDTMPFTSAVGGLLSEAFLNLLNNEIDAELSTFSNKTGSGKRLRVSGSIIHMDDGFFEKQIIVQVRLQDATDGRTIGLANIASQANSIRGLREAAYAVADGLVDFLAQNHFPGLKKSSVLSLALPVTLEQTQ